MLSLSHTSLKSSFSSILTRSKFSTSPFFYSINQKPNAEFRNCYFAKYLSSAIKIDKDAFMIGKVYEYTRQDLKDEPVRVYNSIFREFDIRDKAGAAINVKYRLRIFNALFSKVKGKLAPAFACSDELECVYTTFQNCEAFEECGVFLASNTNDIPIKLELSTFTIVVAPQYGIAKIISDGNLIIKNTNMTKAGSSNTGLCDVTTSKAQVYYSSFVRCSTSGPNGGFVFNKQNFAVQFQYTNFYAISQSAQGKLAGNSIFLSNVAESTIENCAFIRNAGLPSIAADATISLKIIKSCFTGRENNEIKSKDSDISKSGCTFGSGELNNLADSNRDLGYIENRPFTNYQIEKGNANKGSFFVEIMKILIVSIAFGIIVVNFIYFLIHRFGPKKPRALE
ncbi:hypothetical protein TVAG_231220 [Trichomonas vaginalis G3]|uniref:Right handed beta helix domain-containing protein n=1 Tax=Trichomonas vaginalis (strain ATCC PRA-98 / G3) TaxID=412133 RepID=A2F2S2_TRIV3|nr:hypothetical protein TVAGG3_0523810 [Trichomonas vaginalis G3]EAY00782.1 hypothetical protein TVAG_231220 [Trichomonas vaginalis G3]KAI5518630.1 hypothetical protein TVAGG3_0523810 [Trichomonas vaginalis G3]|eukprot:XP_001313711.1 hypothetical protein [Trichomonas vaginalis G3]